MNQIKANVLLTTILIFLFSLVHGYNSNQETSLAKAIQLYDDGNFEEAEKILGKLLEENPEDLSTNYYYGACRTENGHYGTSEIICLLNGSLTNTPTKTEYYLAVQYHAKNRWDEALKHYTRYKGTSTPEEQNAVQLLEKIQQCYDKINPFISSTATLITSSNPLDTIKEVQNKEEGSFAPPPVDSLSNDSTEIIHSQVPILEYTSPEPELKFAPINFVINNEIVYLDSSDFKTKEGLKAYLEGTKKQEEYDEQSLTLEELRKKYGQSKSYTEKKAIGDQILTEETNNYKLNSSYRNLLQQAKQIENEYWENVSPNERELFIAELEKKSKILHQPDQVPEEADTTGFIDPSLFITTTPSQTQIEEDDKDELIYKIQIGAYSRGVPSYRQRQYNKLSYIRKIENYTDENGVVVYTTGSLGNYEDALKMQNQVRQEGIEDAFVVPYLNRKRITLKEAKEIEAER